jgi:uncharacterized protein (DUF433 family)
MSSYHHRIVSDHRVMLGKPIIKGTRITVELILRKLSQGAKPHEIIQMYPHLTEADLQAVYLYAAETIANEEPIVL